MPRKPSPFVNPSGCAGKVLDVYRAAGAAWLERLPEIVADCAERWQLEVLPPFEPLSYNYVCPVIRADGSPAVLKAGVPTREIRGEIDALRCYDGAGIARLFAADREQGVLLIERLLPGSPLSGLGDDDGATRIAAELMRALWRPTPAHHEFDTVTGWASGLKKLRAAFGGGYGPFPAAMVDRAAGLFAGYLGSPAQTLIHGDFHAGNILRAERAPWLLIDPKGVVGDPRFDASNFLLDLPDEGDPATLKRLLDRRAAILSEALGFGRRELLEWAYAQLVLRGWWSYEDHGRGWEQAFAHARLVEEIWDTDFHG